MGNRPQLIKDHINAILAFKALGINDIRSYINIDYDGFDRLFAKLEKDIQSNLTNFDGAQSRTAVFYGFHGHAFAHNGSTSALINTSDTNQDKQLFDIESRLKRLS